MLLTTLRILILLVLLSISGCLTDSAPSNSLSSRTTEVSTNSEIANGNNEQGMADDVVTADKDEGDDEEESSKSKRTVESNFGYGFNDITRQLHGRSDSQGKFRAYPYKQLRLYSNSRTAQDFANQQQQADIGHRPYSTALLSSVSSHNYRTGIHAGTQVPSYYTKSSYQQVPTYQGSPATAVPSASNASPVYSPGSPHAAPVFTGFPQHGTPFFTGNSLAYLHQFPAVTSNNLPNSFLSAGNFHGGPFVDQLTGSGIVALLQNPSGHFGPQFLPVIILRVNNDPSGSKVLQQQGGFSPSNIQADLHGLNLQTLLHPVQQFQVSQQPLFSHFDTTQTEEPPHLLYQQRYPSAEVPKSQKIQPPAATTSQTSVQNVSYVNQKKPVIPTVPLDSPQKVRKNTVIAETDSHGSSEYSHYKYGYKDKV